jgi:hypothetical protein
VRALGGPIWDIVKVDALCQRHMARSIDADEPLARFLANVARTLPPNDLAAGTREVTDSLHRLLSRLESLSRHEGSVAARFTQEFETRAGTPAEVHIEVMQHIHDELVDLHTGLRNLPDQQATAHPPEDENPEPMSDFVCRD